MVAEAAKAVTETAKQASSTALGFLGTVLKSKWTYIGLLTCAFAAATPVSAAMTSFAAAPSVGTAGTVATTTVTKGVPAIFSKVSGFIASLKGAGATEVLTEAASTVAPTPMIPPPTNTVGGGLVP